MSGAGIQEIFQAVKEGKLERVRRICEFDIPDIPYEMLKIQDARSLNGNKPVYKVFEEHYSACISKAEMANKLNLLIRRSLREAYPDKGNQIESIYTGMLLPYGQKDVVEPQAFLDTWNDFIGNSLPV